VRVGDLEAIGRHALLAARIDGERVGTATGVERFARARSCKQMILLTESCRADAVALYESAGFGARWVGFKKKL
jgi:hypothetical protein